MNPNFRELGELTFKIDGSYDLDIESCLNCQFFKSYRDVFENLEEPSELGICEYPFMLIDETVGMGMICNFHRTMTSTS